MNALSRSLLALLIALVALSPVATPRTAHAQFVVIDPAHIAVNTSQLVKDTGLDGIAWVIAKTAISSMTRSLVNWINSGFEGSPAFVTDLRENLLTLSDAVAIGFIDELTTEAVEGLVLNSPYQDEIATAIRTGYYLSTGGSFYVQNPFTLNQYSSNPAAFISGDFSQGGLSAWHAAWTNPQNNPYGAYQLAARELDRKLAMAGGQRLTELDWGDGFLSYRGGCPSPTVLPSALAESGAVVSLNQADRCVGQRVKTPGSVIAAQLNETLPKGMEGLITADEIDEVIGALFQQLVNQVVGQTGLIGVSAPASGGGRPFLDRATDPNLQQGTPNAIDPDVQFRLSAYEQSWNRVHEAAKAASDKCPASSFARTALSNAIAAKAKVDSIKKALAQPGVTTEIVETIMPTTAEIADAQDQASDGEGSTYEQLQRILFIRGCPDS